jgi:antitoxin ParD1/3/4
MSSSLNVSLTDELRKYVNKRASDTDLYATPSEYIRDLIRQDMESRNVINHVMSGLNDLKTSNFSEQSILDIVNEA